MVKEKKILSYFLAWLIVGFLVCFAGINNIFALTKEDVQSATTAQFYDLISSTNYPSVQTDNTYLSSYNFNIFTTSFLTTTANSYGGILAFKLNNALVKNNLYSITIYLRCGSDSIYCTQSTYNTGKIALGDSTSSAASNFINSINTISAEFVNYPGATYPFYYSSSVSNKTSAISYIFKAPISTSYFAFAFTSSETNSYAKDFLGYTIENLGSADNLSQDEVNNIIDNQTTVIQEDITNMQDSVNSNIDDMEEAIVDSNKETQEVIKDQFNSCRDSYNLYNYKDTYQVTGGITVNDDGWITVSYDNTNGTSTKFLNYFTNPSFDLKINTKYKLITEIKEISGTGILFSASTASTSQIANDVGYSFDTLSNNDIKEVTFNTKADFSSSTNMLRTFIQFKSGESGTITFRISVIEDDKTFINYEPYGEEICTNKLDEQNETSKGIWETIKNLPSAFMDMLKGLFIPEDGYFEEWFNDLKLFFEDKLGFLATPFTIIIDFINRYLELDSGADIIINIPDITVPNFEDHIIISATSLNWSELLKSKESFNTLWQLYLSFVDVFLILNFINLCENKYNRIFGGDTTQYEYYTVEDSYTVNDNTGEVTNHRHNQRTTTRKKVN